MSARKKLQFLFEQVLGETLLESHFVLSELNDYHVARPNSAWRPRNSNSNPLATLAQLFIVPRTGNHSSFKRSDGVEPRADPRNPDGDVQALHAA